MRYRIKWHENKLIIKIKNIENDQEETAKRRETIKHTGRDGQ